MRFLSACALFIAALLQVSVTLAQETADTPSQCNPTDCKSVLGVDVEEGQGDENDPIGCCSLYVGENPKNLDTSPLEGSMLNVETCTTLQLCREQGYHVGHRFKAPDAEDVFLGEEGACKINDQYCHNYTQGELVEDTEMPCNCEYPISIYARFRKEDGSVVDKLYRSSLQHTANSATSCTITSQDENKVWTTRDVDCTQQGTSYGCCELKYTNPNRVIFMDASGSPNYLTEPRRMCMLPEDCSQLAVALGSTIDDCDKNAVNCVTDLLPGTVLNETHRKCDCTMSFSVTSAFNPNKISGCPELKCPLPPKGCIYRETSLIDSNGCQTQCGWVDCGMEADADGKTCTVGPCNPIKDGCTVTHSDEFDDDGCPTYPCGINSCGPDCGTPNCEEREKSVQPGCKLVPDTENLDERGCPYMPCGVEVCCQEKGENCPPRPDDLPQGCSIVDSNIVNEDGCLRYPCGMEKCPCYDPSECQTWTDSQLDAFRSKGCTITPPTTEKGDDGCLLFPCTDINCPLSVTGDDDSLNPDPNQDAQPSSPFPAGTGTVSGSDDTRRHLR